MRWGIIIPLACYLIVLAGLAYWAWTRRKRAAAGEAAAQYYVGGRSLGWFVLVFTVIASAASAGTFIGGPGLVYEGGYGWVLVSLFQAPLAIVALSLLGKKFAILGRKLGAVTVTEILRHRYENPVVVVVASLGLIGFLTAYMVPQFVGGTRVLQAATGIDYTVLVIAFAGIVALYTSFGGFLASATSDAFQGAIMLLGGIVVWIVLLSVTGGMGPVNEHLLANNPEILELPGGGDFGPAMIASYSLQLGLMLCVLPHIAVRSMSYRDSAAAHKAMTYGPILMYVITMGFLTMGAVARFFQPDMEVGDLALPTTLIQQLPEGMAGVLFAAPLAAIMSTVDSMILIVSGAIVRDLYVAYIRPATSDAGAARIGSIATGVVGLLVLVFALDPPAYLEYLVIFAIGGLEAVFFVPLIGGLYWKRGNALGAILAMLGGMLWYILATQFLPALALGMFPIATSALVALVLYLLGNYLGPRPSRLAIVKFWGTQAAISAELSREHPTTSG